MNAQPPRIKAPESLQEVAWIVLTHNTDTGSLTMITPEGQSYTLGNYGNAHSLDRVVKYLRTALGDPMNGQFFWAEELVMDAIHAVRSFSKVLVSLDARTISSIVEPPHAVLESVHMRAAFTAAEKANGFYRDDDVEDMGMVIDTPTAGGLSSAQLLKTPRSKK